MNCRGKLVKIREYFGMVKRDVRPVCALAQELAVMFYEGSSFRAAGCVRLQLAAPLQWVIICHGQDVLGARGLQHVNSSRVSINGEWFVVELPPVLHWVTSQQTTKQEMRDDRCHAKWHHFHLSMLFFFFAMLASTKHRQGNGIVSIPTQARSVVTVIDIIRRTLQMENTRSTPCIYESPQIHA